MIIACGFNDYTVKHATLVIELFAFPNHYSFYAYLTWFLLKMSTLRHPFSIKRHFLALFGTTACQELLEYLKQKHMSSWTAIICTVCANALLLHELVCVLLTLT